MTTVRPAAPAYLDERSGRTYPLTDPHRWRGDDGTPLTVTPLTGLAPADVDTSRRSLWRYRAAFPPLLAPVTLGEGHTPLLGGEWDGVPVSYKTEWANPTGSFKDRGASLLVSYLAHHGVTEIIEDSSGNGGSSIAAYCAAAGIRARVLVPEHTSPAKIVQTRAYGAEIECVPGDRDATAAEAVRRAEAGAVYAGHNWHPYFLQGTKTLAYEIWEDLGFRAPDNVVTVAGAGSTVLGCAIGFGELLAAGRIDRLPRLLVAQPAHCAPLYASFRAGAETEVPVDTAPTIAEGTAIRRPVRLPEVLRAIRASGGDMLAVPERSIEKAVLGLAHKGLYAEPTSATAAAAVTGFARRGVIAPGQDTVVILTGSALKTAPAMERLIDGAPR
ncbi:MULTISPECIES: pyridoxal-phosphate dependent enzyme [unclassified Streptomyces]|uniref:pyridoxal-phosphate dependent enzyme n=1 Tax=unclassified Streptomyces TaxID=2593676 RepID=UPI003822C262